MKLRHVLAGASIVLLVGVVLAIVMTVTRVLEAQASNEVRLGIDHAVQALDNRYTLQMSLTEAQTAVVVAEPRLKAVVGARNVDAATLQDVAVELQGALGSDLFLLTDAQGIILADTADAEAAGYSLADRPVVLDALRQGRASSTWVDDTRVYQVHARRLQFGDTVVGALVVGFALDQRFVDAIASLAGVGAAIRLNGKVVVTSDIDPELARKVLASDQANVVELEDGNYLARAVPIPGYAGQQALDLLLVRSLDEALAPSRALTRWIYLVGAVALGLGLAGSLFVASRVSRPVEELERVAAGVRAGDQGIRAQPSGARELAHLATSVNQMLDEVYEARDALLAKQRLENEMAIATRIQTSLVPHVFDVPGLEIGAVMRPASEVGGDYYDVQRTDDGCWVAVGDVAGHGLPAGLVMLLLQSSLAILMRTWPHAPPNRLLAQVNDLLIDTVRGRMGQSEHITLTLIRYHANGRFEFAGAHEDMLIYRAATKSLETVRTAGTWLGLQAGIEKWLPIGHGQLQPGDVLVLHTDGITEATDSGGAEFGFERLEATLREFATDPPQTFCDRIIAMLSAWQDEQYDDQTLVVIKRS